MTNKLFVVFFLFTLTLGSYLPSYAQQQSVYVTRGSEAHSVRYFTQTKNQPDAWLNPYLDEEWAEGYILFADSIRWDGSLRIDLFRKQMEMVISGDTFYISQPFVLNLAKVGETYFVYKPFIEKRRNESRFGADYFEVLNEGGPAKLLLRRSLRIDESGNSPSNMLFGIQVEQKKQFAQMKRYYILMDEKGPAMPVNRGKRSFLYFFPEHKNQMKAFARKERLGFSSPEERTRLIEYYNTLNKNALNQ
jgi:hypothetical protein